MKDILIIREENNYDKPIYDYIKNKYDTTSITFSSKNADFAMASEGISLVIAFVDDISSSSLVEMRRILMYLKGIHVCLIGPLTYLQNFADDLEKDTVHCIELPQTLENFQKAFDLLLAQNSTLKILPKGASGRRHTILLVDDDPVCLRNMMSWMQNFYQVAVAKSGAACLAFLGKNKPDLILLDYEMPVCDGLQTLEMIRNEPDYSEIPVIFLTGVSDTEKVKEAIKLKPQGYVLKGADRIDFMNKINAVFGE